MVHLNNFRLFLSIGFITKLIRPVAPGGAIAMAILADQLTLSQPGRQIMPPHHYWHPPGFTDVPTALCIVD